MSTYAQVYLKHNDLPNNFGSNPELQLCHIFELHVPGQTLGAQMVRGIWSISLKSDRARKFMIHEVKTLKMINEEITIYEHYPPARSIPNEKILFKDLPFHVSNEEIIDFLKDQPGIIVKSGIISARIRDNNNRLTSFYNGDRFVFVKGQFKPALHTSAIVDFNKCRIWHKSQENACTRCRGTDHLTTNTAQCDAYTEENDVISIRSSKHVLCNYYMSYLKVFDMEFASVEHAYQWRFMKYIGLDDYAHQIQKCHSPAEAKEIASSVPRELHHDWHRIKRTVMRDILHAKADYCPLFKSTLMDSVGMRLVESTQDLYWASGLPPRFTTTTKPRYYPGRNELGHILESVRSDLIKEAEMLNLVEIEDNENNPSPPTTHTTDSPPSSPLTLAEMISTTSPMQEEPAAELHSTDKISSTLPPSKKTTSVPLEDASSTSESPAEDTQPSPEPIDAAFSTPETEEIPPTVSPLPTAPSTPVTEEKPPTVSPLATASSTPDISTDAASLTHEPSTDAPSTSISDSADVAVKTVKALTTSDSKQANINPGNKRKMYTKKSVKMSEYTGVTISSMFDAMKRKMSPEKEADTTQDNPKVQRNESYNSS